MPVETTSGASNHENLSTPRETPATPSLNTDGVIEHKKRRGRHKPRSRQGSAQVGAGETQAVGDSRSDLDGRQTTRSYPQKRNDGQSRRQRAPIVNPTSTSRLPADRTEGEISGQSGHSSPSPLGPGTSRRPPGDLPPSGRPSSGTAGHSRGPGRRRQINSKLSGESPESSLPPAHTPARDREAKADNLTNRLTDALRIPPYADCPICFNAIHPVQPVWSCSPIVEDAAPMDDEPDGVVGTQCCYTPFHLKCIKSWASKSVDDMRDAFRARGEPEKRAEWRCPGCQRRRLHVPRSYMCFCGSTPDPRPGRLATPHSCASPCSRSRACGHSCPLFCHPGPCPPCQVTTQLPCHCGSQTKSFRCADLTASIANACHDASAKLPSGPSVELSCGRICDRILGCDRHRCALACHPGACPECPIVEVGRCYCGKALKEMKCGEGEEKHCCVLNDGGVLEEWDGRYVCEHSCGRTFDCGVHKCEKSCHPPSATPSPCPRSTSLISRCPCGKKLLTDLESGIRLKCTDPIMTCGSLCMKNLEGCEHVCSVPCHSGPCPPCSIPRIIPCRCGSTTRTVPCHKSGASHEFLQILCDKSCSALRACGRHQCNRVCCPLASLSAAVKGKGKKRSQAQMQLMSGFEDGVGDEARWHECDLVCGKILGCGNHQCEERDHRGLCPPCLRSSFEEMICHCGHTIIEPPVPCGTRISCPYPCSRLPPTCGHPKSTHSCHEDPISCPPCPFLTSKTCACGKNSIGNVRCSQEKVSCGTACGKLLDCGFHHCERTCHGGNCGTCTSVCGKPRKLCLPAQHECTSPCHAPSACSEDEPCQSTITLKCQCGRIQQPSLCGRCTANLVGRESSQQLKCTNECAIAKRNARLAEALGISQEVKEREGQKPVNYNDELVAFARSNAAFCTVVEKTLADFVSSDRKSHILPHMHEARRKFVHDLAAIYRIDTQMVDQEPNRSVQLIRRIDTRIPKPLLSTAIVSSNLGKLADLRSSPGPSTQVRQNATTIHNLTSQAPSRGWKSVTSASSIAQPQPRLHSGSNSRSQTITFGSSDLGSGTTVGPSSRLTPVRSISTTGKGGIQSVGPVPESWENEES